MNKKLMALLMGSVMSIGICGLAACGETEQGEAPLPPQTIYKPDAPTGEFVAGNIVAAYAAAKLPDWAVEYNKTASPKLKASDLTFTLYDNGYENKISSAAGETGAYEYIDLTGEWVLSGVGKLRETTDGVKYVQSDFSVLLEELDTRVSIGELTGSTHILASGLYDMEVNFTLTLYDNHTFEFGNAMSTTVIAGTWTYNADKTYSLTGEGLTVTNCVTGRRPSITISSSIAGSDGNIYEFEVTVSGLVKNPS